MARIVPGTLVADLSGSVGGLTAQRGAAGLVVRRIGYRRVGNHGYAELVKAVFADARRLWLGLTPVERLAWETFAGGGRSGWACFYAAVFPERVANGTMTLLHVLGCVAAAGGLDLAFPDGLGWGSDGFDRLGGDASCGRCRLVGGGSRLSAGWFSDGRIGVSRLWDV